MQLRGGKILARTREDFKRGCQHIVCMVGGDTYANKKVTTEQPCLVTQEVVNNPKVTRSFQRMHNRVRKKFYPSHDRSHRVANVIGRRKDLKIVLNDGKRLVKTWLQRSWKKSQRWKRIRQILDDLNQSPDILAVFESGILKVYTTNTLWLQYDKAEKGKPSNTADHTDAVNTPDVYRTELPTFYMKDGTERTPQGPISVVTTPVKQAGDARRRLVLYKFQQRKKPMRIVEIKKGTTTTFHGGLNVHQGKIVSDTSTYLVRRYMVVCNSCWNMMKAYGPPKCMQVKRERKSVHN